MTKFKKYRNSYTNSPVIYSSEDFAKMDINEVVSRDKELKSQYRQIGLPTPDELSNSSNVVYVNEYTRGDGTVVRAHWRSKGVSNNSGIMPNEKPVILDEKVPQIILDNPKKQQKSLPMYENNPVLQGGIEIIDELPVDISGSDDSILGTIIDVLPVALEVLSFIISNSNMTPGDTDNISISNIPSNPNSTGNSNVPNINTFNTKTVNNQIKHHKPINPKEFIQKLNASRKENNSSDNNVSVPNNTIKSSIIKPDKSQMPQYQQAPNFHNVSNVTHDVDINEPGVEFESDGQNISVKHSLKPLNSHMQDYINELLKNSENKSRKELNTEIKKFVDKYREMYNQSNNELGKNVGQKWIAPVDLNKYKITSDYGYRNHPIFEKRKFHDGIDIAAPINTPVQACAYGKIVKAQWNGGYGKYIEIKHPDGTISFYGHLNQISVKLGQIVKPGETIGNVGNTGYSTGPHLHWGARKNGSSLNPKKNIE